MIKQLITKTLQNWLTPAAILTKLEVYKSGSFLGRYNNTDWLALLTYTCLGWFHTTYLNSWADMLVRLNRVYGFAPISPKEEKVNKHG